MKLGLPSLAAQTVQLLEEPLDCFELLATIKSSKTCKAPGLDGFTLQFELYWPLASYKPLMPLNMVTLVMLLL